MNVLGIAQASWRGLAACTLAACTVVPPTSNSDDGAGMEPGEPFANNVCFQCALRNCSVPLTACRQDFVCTRWLSCVSECPTDDSGVAAEASCLQPCGLPVSAQVLFGCIQDFSNGFLLGCEQACTPPR